MLEDEQMKYGILILVIVGSLLMLRSYLFSQDGADKDEFEMLKRAWKRHQEEKKDENPQGTDSEPRTFLEALRAAEGKMRAAERRLSRKDPGTRTQEKQREALDLLDDLIKKAEEARRPSESEGGGSEKENQPRPDEGENNGKKPLVDPGKLGEPAKPGSKLKKQLLEKAKGKELTLPRDTGKPPGWKPELPRRRRLRDLESGSSEKRPPKYSRWLENYFKKLMEGFSGK